METKMIGTLLGVVLIVYVMLATIFVTHKNRKNEKR